MAGLFKRGFKAVSEEKERQDKNRENRTKGLWKFFLKDDGAEAEITFLTEEPINYYEHTIKTYQNGKERYESIPCIGDSCKLCKNGEKASFKSAWLVVDHTEVEYTKDGKTQTISDQVRLFIYGTKIASQLDRVSKKYGLAHRTMTMVRMGKGTSTTYTFERGDKNDLSPKEIEELLPEALQKEYEGTEESLYGILERQILLLAGENVDEDKEDKPVDNTLVSMEDDEEEEEKPVVAKKKFGAKKFGAKSENSVRKTSVKKLLKK